MGGLWQALAFGFGGIRPRGETLIVDPRLPTEWNALEFALRFRGRQLRLRIDRKRSHGRAPADWHVYQAHDHWEVTSEMKTILAALDNSLASRSVLASAQALSTLLDSHVEAATRADERPADRAKHD